VEHDIQDLMAVGKLTPLGDPAPRWFAAVDMIRLAADQDWRHKCERRQAPGHSSRPVMRTEDSLNNSYYLRPGRDRIILQAEAQSYRRPDGEGNLGRAVCGEMGMINRQKRKANRHEW